MGKKEKTLEKVATISQLVGMSIITIAVIRGVTTTLDFIPQEFSIGGIGIGAILAWVFPFWIKKVEAKKLY